MTIQELERRVRTGATALDVMRACRAHGVGWAVIADALNHWGFTTPTGRRWTVATAQWHGR